VESSFEAKSTSCVTNQGPAFPWELGTVETFPLLKSIILASEDPCSPNLFPDTVERTATYEPKGLHQASLILKRLPPSTSRNFSQSLLILCPSCAQIWLAKFASKTSQ
jgi:hypothetical protein